MRRSPFASMCVCGGAYAGAIEPASSVNEGRLLLHVTHSKVQYQLHLSCILPAVHLVFTCVSPVFHLCFTCVLPVIYLYFSSPSAHL